MGPSTVARRALVYQWVKMWPGSKIGSRTAGGVEGLQRGATLHKRSTSPGIPSGFYFDFRLAWMHLATAPPLPADRRCKREHTQLFEEHHSRRVAPFAARLEFMWVT